VNGSVTPGVPGAKTCIKDPSGRVLPPGMGLGSGRTSGGLPVFGCGAGPGCGVLLLVIDGVHAAKAGAPAAAAPATTL